MDNTTPSQKWGRLLSFLVIILVMVRRVSTQAGDGVVVTQADFQALQAIKQELIDTKGFLQSWNDSGFGACSGGWAGIKCAGGQVIVIQLPWKLLAGKISHEIGQLQALRKFSLHDNLITGPIPHTLGMLPSLRGLQLFNNRLSASIPPSLASCALLQTLDLRNNSLTGLLPETLGKATKLLRLDVSFNSISGPIPVGVAALSSLAFLHFQHNNLTGEIPAALAYRLPNLVSFNVAYNNLSGWVPIRLAQRFNSTAFVGNIQLCGYSSASAPCRAPPPPTWEKAKRRRRRLGTKDIILIAAGALLVILVLLCCVLLFCLIRRRRGGAESNAKDDEKQASEGSGGEGAGKLVHFDGSMAFTAEDLLCATAEVMGKSTYGTVYKATLEDGSQVAVKRLREKITKSRREFEAEISVLGEIRHPNLVLFRAYYLGPKGEKLLVFDYMPIGSLAAFLHGRGSDSAVDWRTRKNIVGGVTQGLLHLHAQQNIIHGNLTSSNILLDEEGNARIADFGLSRLMSAAANSNVIATAGALGYRAPELSKLKKANTKTDVYSLGVVVLELLTGKPPGEAINGVDLPQWVASVVKEEWTNEVFDEELMKEASTSTIGDELLNTLKLALHCIDPSPAARPEMDQILHQLEQIRLAAATSSEYIRC